MLRSRRLVTAVGVRDGLLRRSEGTHQRRHPEGDSDQAERVECASALTPAEQPAQDDDECALCRRRRETWQFDRLDGAGCGSRGIPEVRLRRYISIVTTLPQMPACTTQARGRTASATTSATSPRAASTKNVPYPHHSSKCSGATLR